MITIGDWGRPDYLDGARMQFEVRRGDRTILAYCNTIEVARAIAHALAHADEDIVIVGLRGVTKT